MGGVWPCPLDASKNRFVFGYFLLGFLFPIVGLLIIGFLPPSTLLGPTRTNPG